MTRKLGVNTWVWTSPLRDTDIPALLAHVAELGFEAVELPMENLGDWDASRTRAVCEALALTPVVIGAMGPGRSLIARAGDVETSQHYLRGCVDAAVAVGASVVAGPFYAPTGVTWRMTADERAATITELQHNLRPLADYASGRGITLAVEPLNRYETSVINTVEQALEALHPLIGHGVGLALDTYHLNIEEKKPDDAIRAAGGAIAHMQVCGSDRGAVGDDHTDWPSIFRALDDAHYDAILGVESFTGENATIAVAASVWRALAESQDALASRSLDALRRLSAN